MGFIKNVGKAPPVDNASVEAKLELRRRFLRKYHSDQDKVRVFDACAGSKQIWTPLCMENPKIQYTGVDVKPKPGRIARDSVDMLRIGMARRSHVIDIDTYGQPFKHMLAAKSAGWPSPLTLFLTIGMVMNQADGVFTAALGITFPVPTFMGASLASAHMMDAIQSIMSPMRLEYAEQLKIIDGTKHRGNMRYYGLRFSL